MAKKRKEISIDREAQRERMRKLDELIERGWAELRAQREQERCRPGARPS